MFAEPDSNSLGRATPCLKGKLQTAELQWAARAGQFPGDFGAEAVAEVVFPQREGADAEGDAVVAERVPERQSANRGA